MILNVVSFTHQGKELVNQIIKVSSGVDIQVRETEVPLDEWTKGCFERKEAILFIGAAGIAVRTIAPYINNKLEDPAVLVMDELGHFVIPILSGHVGGANELAKLMENITGAIAVVTTATDVNDTWAVDNWARANHMSIENKDAIRNVSSRVLANKPVTIAIQTTSDCEGKSDLSEVKDLVDVIIGNTTNGEMLWDENIDSSQTLLLKPQRYVVGIGCKRGKDVEAIYEHLSNCLKTADIDISDIYCLATIDIKKDEEGINALSTRYRIPVFAFSAEILSKVPGEFSSSEFVEEKVGVGNVCERAAMLAAGSQGELICKKQAWNGITIAIAKR